MNRKNTATHVALMLLLAVFTTAPAYANDPEHRKHDSHEHGVAQLNIVWEGNTLHLELESPAMNIIGFEHMPGNSEQRAAVEHAVAELEKGSALFTFSADASCRLVEARVESALMDKGHQEHEAGDADSHADFDVSYRFICGQPDLLDRLAVGLFRLFPGTEELEVQLISDRGQKRAHMTPSNPDLEF